MDTVRKPARGPAGIAGAWKAAAAAAAAIALAVLMSVSAPSQAYAGANSGNEFIESYNYIVYPCPNDNAPSSWGCGFTSRMADSSWAMVMGSRGWRTSSSVDNWGADGYPSVYDVGPVQSSAGSYNWAHSSDQKVDKLPASTCIWNAQYDSNAKAWRFMNTGESSIKWLAVKWDLPTKSTEGPRIGRMVHMITDPSDQSCIWRSQQQGQFFNVRPYQNENSWVLDLHDGFTTSTSADLKYNTTIDVWPFTGWIGGDCRFHFLCTKTLKEIPSTYASLSLNPTYSVGDTINASTSLKLPGGITAGAANYKWYYRNSSSESWQYLSGQVGGYSYSVGSNLAGKQVCVEVYDENLVYLSCLTATTTVAAQPYTIKYNANGGSGTMANQTAYPDTAVNLSKNTFTKSGSAFIGWAKTSTGTVAYSDQQSVTNLASAGSSITLYAKWQTNTEKKYRIVYDSNGGSGSVATQTDLSGGSSYTCNYNTSTGKSTGSTGFTRTDYDFLGWSASSSATSASYTPGSSKVTVASADVTLYAVWRYNPPATTPVTYTISYTLGGGSKGTYAPSSATVGETITISNPTRSGYTFDGWSITNMGTGTHYYGYYSSSLSSTTNGSVNTSTQTYFKNLRNSSGTVYLTANWTAVPAVVTPATYSITYNANGGSGSVAAQTGIEAGTYATCRYNTATGTAYGSTGFTRSGYDFLGWSTNRYAAYASYTPGSSSVYVSGDTVLYAVWEEVPQTTGFYISYNLDGGSHGAYHPTYADEDSWFQVSNPAKPGYDFTGWDITGMPSGQTHRYGYSSSSYSTTSSTYLWNRYETWFQSLSKDYGTVTFSACWQEKAYTVYYNANGGSGTVASQTCAPGSYYYAKDNAFTRAHYTFRCWNTDAAGTGTSYYPGDRFADLASAGGSATLYAQWDKVYTTSTVNYYADGELRYSQTVTWPEEDGGTYITLPAASAADSVRPTSCEWDGWYSSASYSGTKRLPGASVWITGPESFHSRNFYYVGYAYTSTNPTILATIDNASRVYYANYIARDTDAAGSIYEIQPIVPEKAKVQHGTYITVDNWLDTKTQLSDGMGVARAYYAASGRFRAAILAEKGWHVNDKACATEARALGSYQVMQETVLYKRWVPSSGDETGGYE